MPTSRAVPADVAGVEGSLRKQYPDARSELDHRDAFELLVATVLSAQTTDARVNAVTGALFARWPDAETLAAAEPEQVEPLLRPLGMGPTRARRIIGLAAGLRDRFDAQVPEDQDALESLPGVGRKTALVVRGAWFGHDAFAVDTHVGRVSRRLGWTRAADPRAVEDDVVGQVQLAQRHGADPIDLTSLSLRLILHGRRVCTARAPACARCELASICPSAGIA